VTLVDRRPSCVVGWRLVAERTLDDLQALLDRAPQARFYYSDLFALCRQAVYTPGLYTAMPDKSETFRVEGVNAEFRHYLACLARRSRCFPRCPRRLALVLRLFIFAWNRRQLYRLPYPKYPAPPARFCLSLTFTTPFGDDAHLRQDANHGV
jgi:IS1 family transposase